MKITARMIPLMKQQKKICCDQEDAQIFNSACYKKPFALCEF